MKEENQYEILNYQDLKPLPQPERPDRKTKLKHLFLFLLTFISVSGMGALFVGQSANINSYLDIVLWEGVLFAVLLLGFLGVHEFGHYFASAYHKISTSLPYFIPLPFLSPIGTLGAVIRIKDRIDDSKKLFDVGIAGPLAGFVVALVVLLIGFFTLPEPGEYMRNFDSHENLVSYIDQNQAFPDQPLAEDGNGDVLVVGNTLLYDFLASFFDNVPPMWEMYHYPFLFAGWLGLFFTALNLMPVGQLDGGHILYSLIGYKKHLLFARVFFVIIVTLAGASLVPLLHSILVQYDNPFATISWGIWAFVLFWMLRKAFRGNIFWSITASVISLVISAILIYGIFGTSGTDRFMPWVFWSLFVLFLVGIEHPPVLREQELSPGRKILGWLSIVIFILCISANPFYLQ
ncbi:MAG: site-2 protease family protein [Balneolales bacterium]